MNNIKNIAKTAWTIAKPILNKSVAVKGYNVKVWYVLAAIVVVCVIL